MRIRTSSPLDWQTALDASPTCQNPRGCGRVAANRIRWTCGCLNLACTQCTDRTVVQLAQVLLMGWTEFECADCSHEIHARQLFELLRVISL